MKEIIIKTQKELDALPLNFNEYTRIYIEGGTRSDRIVVRVAWGNSNVVARGNANVEAWGNANVEARENSNVVAWENSNVEAWENSNVVAWENSNVVARGNSNVVAMGNSNIKIFSEYCDIKKAMQESVIIYVGVKGKPKKTEKTATVLHKKVAQWTKDNFCELYESQVKNEKLTLYKSVNPDTFCDFQTGKIKYEVGKEIICPDWNSAKTIQCGNGLHLSPTPAMALSYNQGKVLKCEVDIKDFVVYATDITKVRCKKVKVIEEIK